jgi:pyruvate dehydrogenase E2 component (dihydrolipoamide acetyltransferase)
MALIEVKVPDIGDFKDVEIIELLVKPGDTVKADQSLLTVESDKASMEIPSSHAGVVKELKVKIGDKINEGSVVMSLEGEGTSVRAEPASGRAEPASGRAEPASVRAEPTSVRAEPTSVRAEPVEVPAAPGTNPSTSSGRTAGGQGPSTGSGRTGEAAPASGGSQTIDLAVPDIGDFDEVTVIEVFVKAGDTLKAEQSVITVESDKASMEIPSSHAGVVKELNVKVGDKVATGSVLGKLETSGSARAAAPATAAPSASPTPAAPAGALPAAAEKPLPTAALPAHEPIAARGALPHASPSIRKIARELGVPLDEVKGSGPKGRITQEDVQGFVKLVMSGQTRTAAQGKAPAAAASGGSFPGLLPWPVVDFTKFGEIERQPLSRIKKIGGANLHRNWVLIPHVTNHDDADITELEAFRVQLNKENEKAGIKVTMLAFLIKAMVAALKKFPDFNASLDGEELVLKKYFHIGFAADTPNGLVVPVLKDADKKGVLQISQEMNALAQKARDGKLGPADMSGGCISISSLGGIGGRYFTPIINAPEVAILGVCKSMTEPVWDGKAFQPRLMLPLSLSWDHRVIDGASAARFNAYLTQVLSDFRRVLL